MKIDFGCGKSWLFKAGLGRETFKICLTLIKGKKDRIGMGKENRTGRRERKEEDETKDQGVCLGWGRN